MDFNSLTNGQKVAGVSGLLLIVNLFLPWYGVDFGNLGSVNFNAWDSAFSAWGGSLFCIAGAAVLLAKVFGKADLNRGTVKAEQIALGLAGLGALLVLLRVLTETTAAKIGLWLGLILSFATVAGVVMSMKEAGVAMPTMDDVKTLADDSDGTVPPAPPA